MTAKLLVGWSSTDITPEEPVKIAGQFHARVSEAVRDPVTATVLALDYNDSSDAAILISCDLVTIPDELRETVRLLVKETVPEIDSSKICLNATHTHTAPEIRTGTSSSLGGGNVSAHFDIELPSMNPADYLNFASEKIAEAVKTAWQSRETGRISYGLGQAVIGRNRRITYSNGQSRMYGNTADPEFRHVEGYEDHSVNLLCTWNTSGDLTGLVVNVACPSQVSESLFEISADYWHETRLELRRCLGENLFILPQCSAAGDQSPHIQFHKSAELRMLQLSGRTEREEIAVRIADAVDSILPFLKVAQISDPVFVHNVYSVEISRAGIKEEDVQQAKDEAEVWQQKYEALKQELAEHPELREQPRWYIPITAAYRKMSWLNGVSHRFELQKNQPKVPVEIHILRLDEMAIVTNPFEYYVDYGIQIKARSRALQTFVVQLAGSGTYVPTERATAGRSYGAVPASTPVGPEGGQELVEQTVKLTNTLWPEPETQSSC